MTFDWPLIIFLFCLSIPGIIIGIKRLIYFLLPGKSEELKYRVARYAIIQTLVMVLILDIAGTLLSPVTGLRAPVLEGLLQGTVTISALAPLLVPALFYALAGLFIFCILYYGLVQRVVDKQSWQIMNNIRQALGVDGCVLYGGVVEEIFARWGLMNLTLFFISLFIKEHTSLIAWVSIVMSGLLFAFVQLPTYRFAGCTSNRRFLYSFIILSLSQSLLFGYLFWHFGLMTAILAHMIFHLGWALCKK